MLIQNYLVSFSSLNTSLACSTAEEVGGEDPLIENLWGFTPDLWKEVQEKFCTVERLYAAIQDLQSEIKNLKEQFRHYGAPLPAFDCIRNTKGGVCGSYFLIDEEETKLYVVKPLDEDAGCIHSEQYGSPLLQSPFSKHMPLYRLSMREALAYKIAKTIGVAEIIPKTTLGIVKSANFHDLSESIAVKERRRFSEMCEARDNEKLCSIQEYVSNSKPLFEAIHELKMNALSDDEIAERFDQKDFENANILIWTTFDTDAHMGNFLVYPKGTDTIGNEILGLKKIDNGLAFPDRNSQYFNALRYLPNAKKELSSLAKNKILAIDVDLIASQFKEMKLESAISAFKERMVVLKTLAQQDGMTIQEIDREISNIGRKR